MFQYAPPAKTDDLADRPTRDAFLDAWHALINQSFEDEINNLPPDTRLFFSESTAAASSADLPVTWNAFPLSILREHPSDATARWDAADRVLSIDRSPDQHPVPMPFRVQDEYCEWFAYRESPGGPISRIVFTAEAPEYWIELAKHDFDQVVSLYQKHVSPLVEPDDLRLEQDIVFGQDVLPQGSYNPYNKWNTQQGVMHLTHPANTLGAEINLAARATIPRRGADGNRVTEVRRFACCSAFGDPNRSSDPSIGSGVNLTALPVAPGSAAQSITLADPVGLYIDSLAPGVVSDEDGNPLSGWFTIVRGVAGRILMAELKPPQDAAFGLDKIRILGRELTHGGQVAERIQMILYARTANFNHPAPPLRPCSRHCCRPNNNLDVGRVNLNHVERAATCAREAFPELVAGAGAVGPFIAAAASGGAISKLGLTRLAGGPDGE